MEISTDPLPSMVFSCRQCRSIVSDSTQYVCGVEQVAVLAFAGGMSPANAGMSLIIWSSVEYLDLAGASGIQVDTEQRKCSLANDGDG